MDDAAWYALALALTAGGGAWTWYALRNRGVAPAIRAAAFTLLVPAAALTGTLELAGEVAASVVDWGAGVVLSPVVWIGIVLAGISALLFGVSGWMTARGKGGAAPRPQKELPAGKAPAAGPVIDDDLAEIEAILKKRGIS
jgi:hypothetical protein